jgi:hypothetical protein
MHFNGMRISFRGLCLCAFAFVAGSMVMVFNTPALHAQAGWEGETGVFVTPLAYTLAPASGKPTANVAYHYFHAGPIIGDFHEVSTEIGFAKRFEVGYTHEMHITGNTGGVYTNGTSTGNLNYLWQNGFEIYNGKVNLIPENYKKNPAVPAVSVGFIARTGVRNVGDYLLWAGGSSAASQLSNASTNSGSTNGDIYVVASKVVTQAVKKMPIVLSAGVRGTNAELWGMGGNAPDWQAKPFGAVAFVFALPNKGSLILGTEASMQPKHPLGYTSYTDVGGLPLNIPTTLTYCIRIVPTTKAKINMDFGIAQVAGRIFNNGAGTIVDLKARHAWGSQLTWAF